MQLLLAPTVLLLAVVLGSSVHAEPAAVSSCAPADQGCELASRFENAQRYLAGRPGTTGFVLRDRLTGARYRNADAATPIWTASTIKLAMVADLLLREESGAVRLTATDRQQMTDMLRRSDNAAADALWSRYGGPSGVFNADFVRYGMSTVQPQAGFSDVYPYWGFQKATADDFDAIMNVVLTRLSPTNTAAVVAEMQRVVDDQRWGVWGAGADMTPGSKNGWSSEAGGWVVNSVGFAGPQQRYTLAIMNNLADEGGYDDGVETTTRLSQILLGAI
ncbi:MAG: tat pathway signal sequence [Mycobacterium kyogaense]|uniref:serine hydrolase n=1 Tax=Mycobacterium kyogaense TaxID=2212479 RepID=UPI002FF8F534